MLVLIGVFCLVLFVGSILGIFAFTRMGEFGSELAALKLEVRTLRKTIADVSDLARAAVKVEKTEAAIPATVSPAGNSGTSPETAGPTENISQPAAPSPKSDIKPRPTLAAVANPVKKPARTIPESREQQSVAAWKQYLNQPSTPRKQAPAQGDKPDGSDLGRRIWAYKDALLDDLGARWSVWVGGVVLALGAIFFLRYSIEAGFFGPGVRIIVATIFGVLALGSGEWLRRNEPKVRTAARGNAYIPGVLTAVGVLTLFGAVYVSYAIYGFIGSGIAFALLGILSLGAMLLGFLQGPAISALGLVGSMVTPLLVAGGQPSFPSLYTYLVFVTASALLLGRARRWNWLILSAATAAFGWALAGVFWHAGNELTWWLIYLSSLFALTVLVSVPRALPFGNSSHDPLIARVLPLAAYGASAAMLLLMLHLDGASSSTFYACLGAVFIGFAVAASRISLTWTGPGAGILFLSALYAHGLQVVEWEQWRPIIDAPATIPIEGPWGLLFLITGVISATVLAVSALGSRETLALSNKIINDREDGSWSITPALLWASVGANVPVGAFTILWLLGARGEVQTVYSLVGFALVVSALVASEALWRAAGSQSNTASQGLAGLLTPINLFASSAGGALLFALFSGFTGMPLTLSLTAAIPATAYLYQYRPIPALRMVCALSGAALIQHALYTITTKNGAVGETALFNELWLYFAIPAIACWQTSRLLTRTNIDRWSQTAEALALSFAALFAVFQVRHYMHDGNLFAPELTLDELSMQVLVGLSFSLGLSRIDQSKPGSLFPITSMLAMGVSILSLVFGNLLTFNPLINAGSQVIGGTVLNSLVLAYFLPGVFLATIAWMQRKRHPAWYLEMLGFTSLVLLFAYVTIVVRFGFQGAEATAVSLASPGTLELYTYTLVWLLFAMAVYAADHFIEWRKWGAGPAITKVILRAMQATGIVVLASIAFGNLLAVNPLLMGAASVQGGAMVNSLVLAYLIPGILLALVLWIQRERQPAEYLKAMGFGSLILLFVYFTAVVRFGFQGSETMAFSRAAPDTLEFYNYTLVWLLFAIAVYTADQVADRSDRDLGPTITNVIQRAMQATGIAVIAASVFGNLLSANPLLLGWVIVHGSAPFNSLVFAYLLPGLLLASAVWGLRAQIPQFHMRLAGGLSVLMIFTYITATVRLTYQFPATMSFLDYPIGDLETYTYTIAWCLSGLLLATAGIYVDRQTFPNRQTVLEILRNGALAITGFSGVALVFGNMLFANPMLSESAVVHGGTVLNSLLLAFLLPSMVLGIAASKFTFNRSPQHQIARTLFGGFSLLTFIVYGTTIVRLIYNGGDRMSVFNFAVSNAEQYTYSVVWLVFAIVLLAAGLVRRSRALRVGSAIVMILTVAKAFFVDMAALEGILRAFSFVGLGAVLIAMGLVYQRLLIKPEPEGSAA